MRREKGQDFHASNGGSKGWRGSNKMSAPTKKLSWVESKKVPTMTFFVKLSSFISIYLQICHCFLF